MGKIAHLRTSTAFVADAVAARRRQGVRGSVTPRVLASGPGWRMLDVLCTCDAQDHAGEECHSHYSLALVLGGAFHYRGRPGAAFLAAGSILLGQAGAAFRCWHGYGAGDRCLAIQFEADAFEDFLSASGESRGTRAWPASLPVDRRTAGMFAAAELAAAASLSSDEGLDLATSLADRILRLASATALPPAEVARRDAARVLELARWIESDPAAGHSLPSLARRAGLSMFHLARLFRRVVGLPPHAFARRARLREAAREVASTDRRILDVALRAGFWDLSTFSAAFRGQFTLAPRAARQRIRENRRYAELSELEDLSAWSTRNRSVSNARR